MAGGGELSAQQPTCILVLGVYHFANPGLDGVRTEVADVLTPIRQREIESIVTGLLRFRPTVIAVEHLPTMTSALDSTYTAYRAGQHTLSRNETEQIGYRLAARSSLPRVYPVDVSGEFPFEAVMRYAEAHDSSFVAWTRTALDSITREENRRQGLTIPENLRLRNDPADLARGQAFYLRITPVGAGESFVGADLMAKWYARNVRIFANLQRLAVPGGRIVLLIGSGHAPIIRSLIRDDPRFRLVEPLEYLPRR